MNRIATMSSGFITSDIYIMFMITNVCVESAMFKLFLYQATVTES